jgi:hypothetical protein
LFVNIRHHTFHLKDHGFWYEGNTQNASKIHFSKNAFNVSLLPSTAKAHPSLHFVVLHYSSFGIVELDTNIAA